MKENLVNKPLFRLFIPIPLGILVYFVLLLINDNLLVIEESFISQELFFCIALTYTTLEANRLSNQLAGKWSLDSNYLLIGSFLFNVAVTLLVVFAALSAYFIWVVGFPSFSISSSEMKSFGLILGVISVLYNMIFVGHHYLTKRNDEQFNNEQILRDQLEHELRSYQSELRPNLFFESLESSINLLHENPDEAEYFLDKLALVYRYVLLNRANQLISVESEIKAGEELLFLLNERHQNRITMSIDELEMSGELIPGTLPNLLEDIVNSTIITRNRPLEISLFEEEGYLNIRYRSNDRLNPQHVENTFEDLQEAYLALTDHPLMKIQAYGECYYKIPILSEKAA